MIDNPEPPSGRRSRLEDEVLEILYRSDRPPSFSDRLRANLQRTRGTFHAGRQGQFSALIARLDSGLWLVVCLGLGILAYVIKSTSPLLARVLVIACVTALVLAIVRPSGRSDYGPVKRWRGRDMDFSPPSRPLWLDRVFRGQRRPPRR